MPRRQRFGPRVLAGVVLAVLAVGAFLVVFDGAAMAAELRGMAPLPVVAGLGVVAISVACWAESMRRVLLSAGGSLSARQGFLAYATGMFAKQVLPMGNAGGVPIMAYAIDREADVGYNRSLAVVTVADFMGLLSSLVLAVVGVGYVLVLVPDAPLVDVAFVAVAVSAAVLATLLVLLVYRRTLLRTLVLGITALLRGSLGRLSDRIETRLSTDRVEGSLDRYFETVDVVRADRRSLLVAAALSVLGWTLFAVPLWTAGHAVGRPIAFGLVLFIVPVGAIATMVPLPGGLGGVELAIAGMVVATTGVELAVAGAMVVLYRLCVYWFPLAIGLAAAIYTGTSVRQLDVGLE